MTDFDLLAWLDGASGWWWIAFAVALGAIEMATFTYFLIWLALAAFGTGLGVFFSPGLSGMAQLTVFSGLSILCIILGKLWLTRFPPKAAEGPALNRRAQQVIGRTGRALAAFDGAEGTVLVDDVRWRARLASDGPGVDADQTVTIIDADGMTLICEPR